MVDITSLLFNQEFISEFDRMVLLLPKLAMLNVAILKTGMVKKGPQPKPPAFPDIRRNFLLKTLRREFFEITENITVISVCRTKNQMDMARHNTPAVYLQPLVLAAIC